MSNPMPDVVADVARARRFDRIATVVVVALAVVGAALIFGVGAGRA